jgi:predicted aspartyl protease
MGQVHVQVILTNYREAVLARLGQLDASQVHRYETEALIDTGATRSVLPPAVAERLGLIRLDHIEAQYANGTFEEVDLSEVFTIELLGRRANEDAMIMGAHILLGVTVLEKLDLMVDCNRHRLIPYQGTFDQPVFRV